jgi:hypothetical protein
MTGHQTRAERAAYPLARDAIRKLAEASGGCLRPVQLRRTDTVTGETISMMVPCGATLASICPPCAERAKALRAAQCREGWHLEDEPDLAPAAPDELQEFWLILRAEAQLRRDQAGAAGQDTTEYDELIDELDIEVTRAGSAARSPPTTAAAPSSAAAGPGRPGAARTPPRCPPARSPPAPPGGCIPRRMAGHTGPRCS